MFNPKADSRHERSRPWLALPALALVALLCFGGCARGQSGLTKLPGQSDPVSTDSPDNPPHTVSRSTTSTRPLYIDGSLQTTASDEGYGSDTPPQPGETRTPFYQDLDRSDNEFHEAAIDYFGEIASATEFGDAEAGYVRKWRQPIRISITGSPTREDIDTIHNLAGQINSLNLVPHITILDDGEKGANCVFIFDSLNNLANKLPGYRADNYAMFFFDEQNHVIERSTIAVTTGMIDQPARNHLIQEEFIQSLGLGNDSERYRDSIFQQDWTVVQRPSEMDWLVLEMLYRPELSPGQSIDSAQRALRGLYLP